MEGNIKLVVTVFARLEFVVHPDKSIFVSNMSIEYLGFITDTQSMIISSTQMKKSSIKQSCQEVLQEEFLIIKKNARSFPSILALCITRKEGRFTSCAFCEHFMGKIDILWWIKNIEDSFCPIQLQTVYSIKNRCSESKLGRYF